MSISTDADNAVSSDPLSFVRDTYLSGRYASAYRHGLRCGLWRQLDDPAVAMLGARVMRQVGGVRRARLLVLRTWRRHRDLPEARFWYVYELNNPVRALLAMDRFGDPPDTDQKLLRDWFLLRASLLSSLRDFEAADAWWRHASELPASPWLWCVRSFLESARDRTSESLEALDRALAIVPHYAPAARYKVAMLRRARRADEALALACELDEHIEVHGIAMQDHFLRWDRDDFAGALTRLERVVELCPLMERELHDWIAPRIAHAAHLAGDHERVRRLTSNIELEGLAKLGAQLSADIEGGRKVVPVPAVPQDHHTCGPASLTSIAKFWNVPVEHEEVVEEICRDGTTAYSERRWAGEQGWAMREFTMTWDATRQLIDAGLPFAFVTTFETNGHMQVAMGYDARLGSVLIRDPSSLSMTEMPWSELEKHEAAFGPRAMVMVPRAESERLDGLELPDAELFDLLYELEASLDGHDREGASNAAASLNERASDHIITLRANRALADYDADPLGPLVWAEAMLERFPDDHRLQLSKLYAMQGQSSEDERLACAERFVAAKRTPALLSHLAALVDATPGGRERARLLLWHALDGAGASSAPHRALANHLWESEERLTATLLYRFASCLADGDDGAAWAYFLAERLTGDVELGFAYLRRRVERFGETSPGPARTLAEAYEVENRHEEGLAALEAAERTHADDGAFLRSMAEYHMHVGRVERAQVLLERARGSVKETLWLRSAAELATILGDKEQAIEHWRAVIAVEPLAMDALSAIADFISTTAGPESAVADLDELCEKFPYHRSLANLRFELLSRFDDRAAHDHVVAFSQRHPSDCWAHREIALALARDGDTEAALARLERARALGDDSAQFYTTKAAVHESAGDANQARHAYRRALERSVDNIGATSSLLQLATDRRARIAELEFIHGELLRQRSEGEGIHNYYDSASDWLDHGELAAKLDELIAARPDSFDAHLARVRLHSDGGDDERAVELANAVAKKFPLVPGAWRALANVRERTGDINGQVDALQRALAINPRWGVAIRELAIAHVTAGDADRARIDLERAVAQQPLDPVHRGYLADLLWQLGDRNGAIECIKQALRLSPGYRWGWEQLARWSDDPNDAVEFGRELSHARGTTHAIWIALADMMHFAPLATRLECIDEAIRLEPSDPEAYDLKACLLAEAGKFDAALGACEPPLWGKLPPVTLRGRAAWVRRKRGDGERAFSDMLELVRGTPTYGWGVRCLLEWAREDAERPYLEACRKIVEAAPESATAHAEYGEALRLQRQFSKAEESFRRALELAPRDRYATLSLVDLYLDQERVDDAAEVMAPLDPTDLAVMTRRVRVATLRGDPDGACREMTSILRLPDSEGVLDEVFANPMPRRVDRAVRALMDEWVQRPDATRHVGLAWFAHSGKRLRIWRLWRRLSQLPRGSDAQIAAVQAYVESLADRGNRWLLALLTRFRGELLRASAQTWGSVGFAFVHFRRWRRAVRWLRDFGDRDGVESWMLWNLSLAARSSGQHELAANVSQVALTLADDATSFRHRLRLACTEALIGNPDLAAELLANAEGLEWHRSDRLIASLTRSLLTWRAIEGDERGRYRQLASELRAARAEFGDVGRNAECLKIFRWVVREVARERGGLAGAMWWLDLTVY